MSANTLVAFCVGCLFLLALATIILVFLERKSFFQRYLESDLPMPPSERVTKAHTAVPTEHGWPAPPPGTQD